MTDIPLDSRITEQMRRILGRSNVTIEIKTDSDSGVAAWLTDFPGCIGQGRDIPEAVTNLFEIVPSFLAKLKELGQKERSEEQQESAKGEPTVAEQAFQVRQQARMAWDKSADNLRQKEEERQLALMEWEKANAVWGKADRAWLTALWNFQ